MSTAFTCFSYVYSICLYTASSLDDLIILRSISKSFYNNIMQDLGSSDIWKSAIPKIDKGIHFRLSKMLERSLLSSVCGRVAASPCVTIDYKHCGCATRPQADERAGGEAIFEDYFIIWAILTHDQDLVYRRPCAEEGLLIRILETRNTCALKLYLMHIDSFDGKIVPFSWEKVGGDCETCQIICTHNDNGSDSCAFTFDHYVKSSWKNTEESGNETVEEKLSFDSCFSLLCEKNAEFRYRALAITLGNNYWWYKCNVETTKKMLAYFVKRGWVNGDGDYYYQGDGWMFGTAIEHGSRNLIGLMSKYFEENFEGHNLHWIAKDRPARVGLDSDQIIIGSLTMLFRETMV